MSTKLGDITLTKKSGTVLTLNTEGKYVHDDKYFTIAVQDGVGSATVASIDASIGSDSSNRNISGAIGQKSTTAPVSGYYFKVDASGTGTSTVSSAGWMDAGSTTATANGSYYFPVQEATITGSATISGTDTYFNSGTSSNYDVAITPSFSNTEGYIAEHSSSTTGTPSYYKVKTATPAFDGGALSGGSTATATNATLSSTNNSGVQIQTAYTAHRDAVLYNGAVNGWVSKADDTQALASADKASTNGTAYYIDNVTVKKNKVFSVYTDSAGYDDLAANVYVYNTNNRKVSCYNWGTVNITDESVVNYQAGADNAGSLSVKAYFGSSTAISDAKTVVSGGKWYEQSVQSTGTYYGKTNVLAGTITNNTSGGTSSGTINRGAQIKIGKGCYDYDRYYTAASNSGTLNVDTTTNCGTINCDGYANVNLTGVNVPAGSSFSVKVPNGNTTVTFVFNVDANGNVTITES